MKRPALFLIVALCALLWPAAGLALQVAPALEVGPGDVTLADLLSVAPEDPVYRRAEAVVLASAPEPGCELSLRREYIEARAASAGVALDGVRIPERVTVSRATRTISGADIDGAVADYIRRNSPYGEAGTSVEVLDGAPDVVIADGEVGIEVVVPRDFPFAGTRALSAAIVCDGQRAQSVWVKVDVRARVEAVVASRDLRKGQMLRPEDLTTRGVELGGDAGPPASEVATRPEQLIGKRTRRPVAAGQLISLDAVVQPPAVERGDVVTIVARSENMTITAQGEALQPGEVGETIRVRNLSSGRELAAVVRDSRTVVVDIEGD